jgi:hypothetical protein
MTVSIAGRKAPLGAVIAGLGAVLAMVASFLVWASFTRGAGLGGSSDQVTGMDYSNGKITLGFGIVVLGLVVAWILRIRIAGLCGLVAIFGALILLVMTLTYLTGLFYPRTMTVLAQGGRDNLAAALQNINHILDQAKANGADTAGSGAGLGIGFYTEILAALLMVAGGLLGLYDLARPAPKPAPRIEPQA